MIEENLPPIVSYGSREVELGDLKVDRALPTRNRRLVGPWCFLDRYGPLSFTDAKPMDVAPHPHIGLQTVTWLVEGEVLHDDSLGNTALLATGGVNIMTSGAGISHSEQTPAANSGKLSGVQLWIALPDRDRSGPADLQHIVEVPVAEPRGGRVRVFSGTLAGAASPAKHYSDIVGADVEIHSRETLALELNPLFEHSALVLNGECEMDGKPAEPRLLYYLAPGRSEIHFRSPHGGRVLLLGGTPFPEPIVMWWNFVARTREEIAAARADWEVHHPRFGEVMAYSGPRIEAPALNRS